MNFGDAWKGILGECDKKTSFEMLDYFYEQGGNFIDTAVNYQDGESETWLGEWMEKHDRRHEMVIATKYTGGFMSFKKNQVIQSNFGGNSTKSMYVSIENSLKRLKSDYIDLVRAISVSNREHPLIFCSTTSTFGTSPLEYQS